MINTQKKSAYLKLTYKKLFTHFGPQYWWPAVTDFEVIIGAILTQNTSWKNVEKAIKALRKEKLLTPRKLHSAKVKRIAALIRPCGYYNIKAARIKNFLESLFSGYKGKLSLLFSLPVDELRKVLLSINGIGPETADSIMLYAAEKPVFVIDAYTKRFLSRHKLIEGNADYHSVQDLFMKSIPRSTNVYNEYHALIVRLAKDFCRTKPVCSKCPLKETKKRKKMKISL